MSYSKEIEKILKLKKIELGDRIKVIKGKRSYEGFLMPRIELGDKNSLIMKLDSGYNIGIELRKDVMIEKIGKSAKLGKIPTKKIVRKKGLPDVSLIASGGTIATHIDYKTGGVYMCRSPEEILTTTPELEEIINLKNTLRPFTKASEDMNYRDWQKLAKLAAKELNNEVNGVIITHGTDTLHFTSAALSFMLKNLTKPVALVGAQRSPDRGSFDGAMNLVCASHFAGYSNIAEVCIVMHGSIEDTFCYAHRGCKCRKMHTSRRDAFRSINELPIAKIWYDGRIEIVNKNYRKVNEGKVVADTKFEPKIALVKTYVGSDPDIMDWYVDRGYKGIVLEGTGLGNVPTGESGTEMGKFDPKLSWIPHIKNAVDKGVIVVITSQCIYGRVNPFVYRNLRLVHEAGAIYGEDMLPEVSYVKLGWVLGHVKEFEKVKKLMLTNIAGEISKRIDPRAFLV